jgi:hypothetical protein
LTKCRSTNCRGTIRLSTDVGVIKHLKCCKMLLKI